MELRIHRFLPRARVEGLWERACIRVQRRAFWNELFIDYEEVEQATEDNSIVFTLAILREQEEK